MRNGETSTGHAISILRLLVAVGDGEAKQLLDELCEDRACLETLRQLAADGDAWAAQRLRSSPEPRRGAGGDVPHAQHAEQRPSLESEADDEPSRGVTGLRGEAPSWHRDGALAPSAAFVRLITAAIAGDREAALILEALGYPTGPRPTIDPPVRRPTARAEHHDSAFDLRLAERLVASEDVDGLRAEIDAGNDFAAAGLGTLARRGRLGDALTTLRQSADLGSYQATRELVDLLIERNEREHAIVVLRRAADAGDGEAGRRLVDLFVAEGDMASLRAEVDAGTPSAASRWAEIRTRTPAENVTDPQSLA